MVAYRTDEPRCRSLRSKECEVGGDGVMDRNVGVVLDPETVELLTTVLDDAWAHLLPEQQATVSRDLLAERLLRAAARGERDPETLRARALFIPVTPAT
jgi:hypothetical protein